MTPDKIAKIAKLSNIINTTNPNLKPEEITAIINACTNPESVEAKTLTNYANQHERARVEEILSPFAPDTSHPAKCYDITIPHDEVTAETMQQIIPAIAKHWVYAAQTGEETGYNHWQCRISLKQKTRLKNAIQLLQAKLGSTKIHVEKTESERGRDPRNPEYYEYCSNTSTLMQGTRVYSDKDKNIEEKLLSPIQWYSWQQDVLNMPNREREIILIYDPIGATGKSTLWKWCKAQNIGDIIPPMRKKDIMRRVWHIARNDNAMPHTLYVDIERGYENDEEMREIYTALETIKSGYAYDERYSWKDVQFKPPKLVVFANKYPDFNWLSKDRWTVYTIQHRNLVKQDVNEIIANQEQKNNRKTQKTRKQAANKKLTAQTTIPTKPSSETTTPAEPSDVCEGVE